MKMHYDQKSDALYLRLDDSKIINRLRCSRVSCSTVVGVEILRVKERVLSADLNRIEFEFAGGGRRIRQRRAPRSPFPF